MMRLLISIAVGVLIIPASVYADDLIPPAIAIPPPQITQSDTPEMIAEHQALATIPTIAELQAQGLGGGAQVATTSSKPAKSKHTSTKKSTHKKKNKQPAAHKKASHKKKK